MGPPLIRHGGREDAEELPPMIASELKLLAYGMGVLAALAFSVTAPAAPHERTEIPSARALSTLAYAAPEDTELKAYAAASTEVLEVRKQWVPRVEEAAQNGPVAALRARDEAMAAMVAAVQQSGLSLARFNQITEIAQTDPDVRRKLFEHIKATR
jgi:hypothetical protein